jgi:hypothetical protein
MPFDIRSSLLGITSLFHKPKGYAKYVTVFLISSVLPLVLLIPVVASIFSYSVMIPGMRCDYITVSDNAAICSLVK